MDLGRNDNGGLNMIEICISCVESVEWGSGRFVNRVPTDDGWLCEECADLEMICKNKRNPCIHGNCWCEVSA